MNKNQGKKIASGAKDAGGISDQRLISKIREYEEMEPSVLRGVILGILLDEAAERKLTDKTLRE